jgi:long-chain acyl-CoA synthetase
MTAAAAAAQPGQRPFAWERSYPRGARWDAPIEMSTLSALLDRSVADFPDQPAIEFRERRTTYRELGRLVDTAAAALLRLGIGFGDAVALYLPNVPYHPIAFFAAMRIGARIVHLSPLDAERELAHKLQDSGARTLVTVDLPPLFPMALKLRAAGGVDRLIVGADAAWGPSPVEPMPIPDEPGIIPFARLLDDGAPPPAQWPAVGVDDVAVLQYTGGTTGIPKAAMLTHRNLSAAVSMYQTWYEPQDLSRRGVEKVVCVLPLFHIFALTTILLRHISNGSEILLRMRFDVETALRDIEEKRATIYLGVPTMWIALVNHPDIASRDLSSLRNCSSGGAPLPVETEERFKRLTGVQLGGGWGMTETSPAGTVVPEGVPETKRGTVGLPLPGIMLDIVALDDPRRVLPPREIGEIRVKGPNVTRQYWNRPDETETAFVDGYLLTGDVGYMDEDGYFFLVDRKKDMIISGGFNVYPSIIEGAIYEHPDVAEVIVIGIPDPHRGQAAKAFVTLRPGAPPLTLDALRAFLADKIGRHEMPAALELRDALPRTAVGKLSKKELVEEEKRRAASAPST